MTLCDLGKAEDCFTNTVVILTLKYIYGCATPKWLEMLLQVIKYTILTKNSKSQRTSKLHYWLKSYGNVDELVDFDLELAALAASTAGVFKEIPNPKLYY